jgi:hypothetical protein
MFNSIWYLTGLSLFTELYELFQSKRPFIRVIKPAIESLLVSLAKSYMNSDCVEEHISCLSSLDHLDHHEFVPLAQTYVG